jgi:hypothetical protein
MEGWQKILSFLPTSNNKYEIEKNIFSYLDSIS